LRQSLYDVLILTDDQHNPNIIQIKKEKEKKRKRKKEMASFFSFFFFFLFFFFEREDERIRLHSPPQAEGYFTKGSSRFF